MDKAALKLELYEIIEQANVDDLIQIYTLVASHLDNKETSWDNLSEYQKNHILEGLEQANAELGRPAMEVSRQAREKYGLNG